MRECFVFSVENGGISACGPSAFCDETKGTKSSFRGVAPETPFYLGKN